MRFIPTFLIATFFMASLTANAGIQLVYKGSVKEVSCKKNIPEILIDKKEGAHIKAECKKHKGTISEVYICTPQNAERKKCLQRTAGYAVVNQKCYRVSFPKTCTDTKAFVIKIVSQKTVSKK